MKSLKKQEYSNIEEVRARFIEIAKETKRLKGDNFIITETIIPIDYLVELAVTKSVRLFKTSSEKKKALYENIHEAAEIVKVDELTLGETLIKFMYYIDSIIEKALEQEGSSTIKVSRHT